MKMDNKLKAYIVFPGIDPCDMGCALIYAYKSTHARLMGITDCPWEVGYIEMQARRRPDFDQYAISTEPHVIRDNSEIGAKFYNNEADCEQ